MAQPTQKITDPDFKYRNSAQTDVTATWRKFGWKQLPKTDAYVEPTPTAEAPVQRVSRVLRVAGGKV